MDKIISLFIVVILSISGLIFQGFQEKVEIYIVGCQPPFFVEGEDMEPVEGEDDIESFHIILEMSISDPMTIGSYLVLSIFIFNGTPPIDIAISSGVDDFVLSLYSDGGWYDPIILDIPVREDSLGESISIIVSAKDADGNFSEKEITTFPAIVVN